jgi:putative endonuclease
MQPAVYIVCDRRHGTLYTGVTSDLARRVWAHRTGIAEGFSKRYGLKLLVWYEVHTTMESATSCARSASRPGSVPGKSSSSNA